jgi:hypothetical protein
MDEGAHADPRPTGDIDLRAFGVEPADLDIDFGDADRAAVVTAVLERCARTGDGAPLSQGAVWALPVGVRVHALVVICQLSGWRALTFTLECPAPNCDEEIEIELPLAALADAPAAGAAAEPLEVRLGDATIRPRRPTGADLRGWRQHPPSDGEILAALGGPRPAPTDPRPDVIAAVEEALAAADPLVDVSVRSDCPACEQALDVPVDLEGEAIALARKAQDALLRDVATIARAFHWSEREILALPPQRRRRYLTMLERADA